VSRYCKRSAFESLPGEASGLFVDGMVIMCAISCMQYL